MKTLAYLPLLLLSALLAAPALADTVITFDDLPTETQENFPFPLPLSTYDGFAWTNFDYYSNTDPVYTNGVFSPPNAALSIPPAGNPGAPTDTNTLASISGRSFTLVSFYATRADPTYGGPYSFTVNGFARNGASTGTTTINPTITPTQYTVDLANITEIQFVTQYYTGLDNFDIVWGNFSAIPTLTPNEQGVAASIDLGNVINPNNPSLAYITNVLSNTPQLGLGAAIDQLMPLKFNNFASTTAFNNEDFETAEMNSYVANLRGGQDGGFLAGNGRLDTSGLTVNDPDIDPGLQMIHSRMLAWDQPNAAISDVPGAVLGGIDMKDTKQMKSCPPCTQGTTPWDFFVRGNVVLGQGLSQGDQPHFDDNTESVVVGADYHVTSHFLAGLTASYAHTDATLDTFNSSATVDSYSPGIYASYADKGWFANFQGRYSYNSYTESRNIAFLGQTANAGTNGNEGTADLDGGYEFHTGPWTYGPVAGLQYTHLSLNSYSESGSAADLNVNEDQSDSLRSRLGGSVRFTAREGSMYFTPHLTATWQHEFMDAERGITSQFTQFAGGDFVVRTEGTSDDFALVDAGLDAQINDTISIFGDYLVQAGQDTYFGQSVQAGVNVRF